MGATSIKNIFGRNVILFKIIQDIEIKKPVKLQDNFNFKLVS